MNTQLSLWLAFVPQPMIVQPVQVYTPPQVYIYEQPAPQVYFQQQLRYAPRREYPRDDFRPRRLIPQQTPYGWVYREE